MKCPKCSYNQSDGLDECKRCGLIFSKFLSNSRPGSIKADTAQASVAALKFPACALLDDHPFFFAAVAAFSAAVLLATSVNLNEPSPGQAAQALLKLPMGLIGSAWAHHYANDTETPAFSAMATGAIVCLILTAAALKYAAN